MARTLAESHLHAFLAACGLRFDGVPNVFAQPCRRVRPPLTEVARAELAAQHAEVERQLWAHPYPVPSAEPFEHAWQRITDQLPDSPRQRAWQLRRARLGIARYGLRRLRTGHEWWWQTPLAQVRAETAATLRQLGHGRFAGMVAGERTARRRSRRRGAQRAVQMELEL
jgi:hypothetical protein